VAEMGFRPTVDKGALRRAVIETAIKLAHVSRNTTRGKEARKALRAHMDVLHKLCGVPDFKDADLETALAEAFSD
jgi:hypothetical protein